MYIARLQIKNFRGVKSGELLFNRHVALVGDNNSGKSTVLEAIDLVLGPERLARRPVVDEHDFYAGEYKAENETPIEIIIEVLIADLTEEQCRRFHDHLEFWDSETYNLQSSPPPENTEKESVLPALRVGFKGYYDMEEDDFSGETFFFSPQNEDGTWNPFSTRDKRECGFLFLRTLRTGSRALSLERGSLLDIILKLQEKRLQMWEDVLSQLKNVPVAENPELGIKDTLEQIQEKLHSIVPTDWANNPRIKVSDLTREHLRRTLTVFMDTGVQKSDGTEYAAPFQHQGTGTINTLVLSLLAMIAELKENVIFAMEEPEIAIPPHTQKRIVESVQENSTQAIFTSHSPYILEEFSPEEMIILQRNDGELSGKACSLPPNVKLKSYKEEFRRRFCEALLARRVLIAEGRTEYDAWSVAAKKLNKFKPKKYKTLSNLGVAVINAETDSQIASLGEFFKSLDKDVFAVFDHQSDENKEKIIASGVIAFEAQHKGFEDVIIEQASEDALRRFAKWVSKPSEWPDHLKELKPAENDELENIKKSLRKYFRWGKGSGTAAKFISQCKKASEIPIFIRKTLASIASSIIAEPSPESDSPKRNNSTNPE